jgi:hypothetical protein
MKLPLTRLNFEPAAIFNFSHTLVNLSKIFLIFKFLQGILVVFYIFSTFHLWFKDLKVVHAILARERQQTNMKTYH